MKFIFFLLFAVSHFCYSYVALDTQAEQEVVVYAQKNLPNVGFLKIKHGYVYLKVDNKYIKTLLPMLHNPALEEPPYFRRPGAPGAHISVVYTDERGKLPRFIPEINKTFRFTVIGFKSVTTGKGKSYYVLTVDSPELEEFRKKYDLSPLLKGHPFHITIAISYEDSSWWQKILNYFFTQID